MFCTYPLCVKIFCSFLDCLSPGVIDPAGGTEMFFFPDEDSMKKSPSKSPSKSSQKQKKATDSPARDSVSSSTISDDLEQYSADEEFCIIDDPGLGIAVRILYTIL